MASPEVSARSPRWPASLMVRMARRIVAAVPDGSLLLHASFGPERQLHDLRGDPLAPALHFEPGAGLGHGGREIGRADPSADRRAHGAAPDDVDLAAVVVHRVPVSREAAALELEADQTPGHAAPF